MANRDVLAIGTSAGGFDALRFLAASFPADFPAVILVTIHLSSHFPSSLDTILSAAGRLMACFPADGEAATPGRIYIAPPERHLIFDGDRLWLGTGPRENHSRPAIDPMFRSVAACCGARAVGAVLTGTLGDGASGLWALKQSGGESVVQDPKDAAYSEMPMSALNRVHPDHVVSLAELPALLERLAREPAGKPIMPPARLKYEVEVARSGRAAIATVCSRKRRAHHLPSSSGKTGLCPCTRRAVASAHPPHAPTSLTVQKVGAFQRRSARVVFNSRNAVWVFRRVSATFAALAQTATIVLRKAGENAFSDLSRVANSISCTG
ncbi:MAG: chemotaxis protein CheB [Xanthobacteraceae bacterium]